MLWERERGWRGEALQRERGSGQLQEPQEPWWAGFPRKLTRRQMLAWKKLFRRAVEGKEAGLGGGRPSGVNLPYLPQATWGES